MGKTGACLNIEDNDLGQERTERDRAHDGKHMRGRQSEVTGKERQSGVDASWEKRRVFLCSWRGETHAVQEGLQCWA